MDLAFACLFERTRSDVTPIRSISDCFAHGFGATLGDLLFQGDGVGIEHVKTAPVVTEAECLPQFTECGCARFPLDLVTIGFGVAIAQFER